MNVPVGVVFLMCGTFIFLTQTTCAKTDETERLLRDLYNIASPYIHVRPNADLLEPVVVTFGISVSALLVEDAKQGLVKAHGYLDLLWTDKRLAWHPLEYGNISMMRIPSGHIWLPDIRLYNNFDASSRMYAEKKPVALVTSEGGVHYAPPVTLALDCNVTKTRDEKISERRNEVSCKAKFGSWSYDGFQLDLVKAGNELGAGFGPGRYRFIESSITRESITYPCCKEPYPSIMVTFKAQQMY